jgi:hypothetical protein
MLKNRVFSIVFLKGVFMFERINRLFSIKPGQNLEREALSCLRSISAPQVLFDKIKDNRELTLLVIKDPVLRKKLGKYDPDILSHIEGHAPAYSNGGYIAFNSGGYLATSCKNFPEVWKFLSEQNLLYLLDPKDRNELMSRYQANMK